MKYNSFNENGLNFIELDNENGLKVTLCDLGASIYSIYFNNELMTLTPKNSLDYKKEDIYHGKTIGAIGNRVKEGRVIINGITYQMDQNEEDKSLHGGKKGLSNQKFISRIIENNDSLTVLYRYDKLNMIDGLPGNIQYNIKYTLYKDNLLLEFKAETDKDTVMALTNHSYFTLGDRNLDDTRLFLNSSHFIEADKDTLLPIKLVKCNEVMSFKKEKLLMKDIDNPLLIEHRAKGYDHHFEIKNEKKKDQIRLSNSRYQLTIKSDFSGMQMYTCNYDAGIEFLNTDNKLRQGVAIEPQDSLLERKTLKANKTYSRHIIYSFRKINNATDN